MGNNGRLVRIVRALALCIGLVVLTLSVVTSVLALREKESLAVDSELTITLSQQTGALEDYFDRSRAINSLLADNPVFTDFFRAPGTNQQKIDSGGPTIDRINTALVYLERLFPGRIGEACFIDSNGREIARVVHGVPAAAADLSADEAANPFFSPTLSLPAGTVYQAQVYESPDTHERVISNSTVVSAAGRRGIVHYEITLDSFRMAKGAEDNGTVAAILDAGTGEVLVDSRTPAPVAAGGPHPAGAVDHHGGDAAAGTGDLSLREVVRGGRAEGITTIGDRRVAYQRLAPEAGNANDWYVAISAPRFGDGWTAGLGVGSLALMIGAVVTIMVAGASLRSHHLSLRHSALHDALTGLPNRTLLSDRLGQALRAGRRGGSRTAALIVDLDRFKEVNDVLGHHHGDLLLREVACRLTSAVREVDTVARLGGDEFAVVLPVVSDVTEAETVAARLLAALHDSFLVNGVTLDVEASIGLAVAPEHGAEPDELLRRADAAMYLAKERNSGCVRYDADQQHHAPTRLTLLGDLRRALGASDQMFLHYQPKVDLRHGALVGVEALIRWRHPQRGMLAPDSFIPVAESTALIQRLTDRVLALALAQARAWLDAGLHVPVAVNLSTRCLLDLDFPDSVAEHLERHGVPAGLLHLEITETAIMAEPERALAVLRALHDTGIRLSIDDFGTGHSSMAYLKQLPVDELKIDRSFVSEMTSDPEDAVMVRSAVDLGHNLGLVVVAEGVEDEGVLAALRELGCDIAQGYHLGRPAPAGDLLSWLAKATRSDAGARA